MRRETVYVCSYDDGSGEHVGRVRAWDGEEAAEAFARELAQESGSVVPRTGIRVRVSRRHEPEPASAA